jgi:hypothetical protein
MNPALFLHHETLRGQELFDVFNRIKPKCAFGIRPVKRSRCGNALLIDIRPQIFPTATALEFQREMPARLDNGAEFQKGKYGIAVIDY